MIPSWMRICHIWGNSSLDFFKQRIHSVVERKKDNIKIVTKNNFCEDE